MLDETTCPVCGKNLLTVEVFDKPGDAGKRWVGDGQWAVAHYLAHLVQQKVDTPTPVAR